MTKKKKRKLLVAHNLGTKTMSMIYIYSNSFSIFIKSRTHDKQYVFFKIYIIRKGGIILDFFSMEFRLFLFLPRTILLLYN